MSQLLKYVFVAALALIMLSDCKDPKSDGFDRIAMLTNLGNSVIVPAHQNFSTASIALKQKKDSFIGNPSSVTLDSLKAAFLLAYNSYMQVEAYSFTYSEGIRNLNVFPTDTPQIITNVSTGIYDLNAANNIQAKGFPAIDYLLYSRSNSEIINLFTTDVNATKRKQYLSDITNEIETVSSNASSSWNNDLSQFISASGIDVGSSVGMLVNDISFETERCRRERVGNALGYIGLINSGTTLPLSVEAYYSVQSKELLIKNLQACKEIYTGGSGIGFDDYLDYIDADYDGQPLSLTISNQFDLAIQKAQSVPVDFSTAVNSSEPEMGSLFLELKKLTVLLKVEMSSRLGVTINYTDNDGD